MLASVMFQEKFQKDYLESFYHQKIAHKSTPGIDRINRANFEKRLSNHIEIINRKSKYGSYKYTPYREKLISKGKGKAPRTISIPTIRDKITLGVLNEILTEAFKSEVNNKIPHIIVEDLKNALNNNNFDYFIKIDIKGFYDNIDQDILLKKIKRKVRKKEVLDLIHKAILNPTVPLATKANSINEKGVPQGISISNILANIYLIDVDKKYNNKTNIKYFRYVDDILILCKKKDYKRVFSLISYDLCEKLNLEINEKKDDGNITKGFEYLGYKYSMISKNKNKYGFTVNAKSVRKLENSIINIFAQNKLKPNSETFIWNLNLRVTGFIIDTNKFGWVFFYSQIDDLSVLYHFDWFVSELCKKYKINTKLQLNIKKFVTTYYEIIKRRGKSKYIPKSIDFDFKQQKNILVGVFGFSRDTIERLPEKEVTKIFKSKIYISVKELEKDVQSFS